MNRPIKIISAAAAFLLLIAVSCFDGQVQRPAGFSIVKGKSNFMHDFGKLKNPYGIVPTPLYSEYSSAFSSRPEILPKVMIDYYEFFTFDDNLTLIILSVDPFYYIKIESRSFYFHLMNEYNQIKGGLTGVAKAISSITKYSDVGEYSIEIYFTPKEIKYSTSGVNLYRILDSNGTTSVDPWRLIEGAGKNVVYYPSFEDLKIHEDIAAYVTAGRKARIYGNSTTISSPQNYYVTSSALNFAFITGTDLTLTENILGTEDIRFADIEELTRDYAVFFSLPPGNSKGTNNNLNLRDGIAVVVRGYDISPITRYLASQGIDFSF